MRDVVAASCIVLAAAACAVPERAPVTTGFVAKTLASNGVEHRYAVYVPPGYTDDREWPLIVFLHGMGECGTDGSKHLDVGLGPALRAQPDRWPFVVVLPQKPDRESQWAEHDAMVMAMLAAAEREYRIDRSRRLLTGLSQGGAGTWALGAAHPGVWAAIAPVCGYGRPADVAPKLTAMPIRAFHGLDDRVVPPQQSKDLVAAVNAAGGSAALTEYEGVAHNSWDAAYRESPLAEWLQQQVRR